MGRVAGLAVVDIAGTALIALLLSARFGLNPAYTVLGAFVLGEAVHLALGIRTPLTAPFFST
jgi:hypothetical protein